jgi:hypothetical protein
MPAEQRIIGGGLLIIGVAVVLILIFFFSQGELTAREAHDKLMDETFPAWLTAEEDRDYLKQKRASEEALSILKEGGKNGVIKILQAATTDKKSQRLLKLIQDGGFEKNAEGMFEFDKGWYGETSHRALRKLRDAVEGVKLLREVRDIAHATDAALGLVRLGSGMAVPAGAVKPVPKDDVPVMEPNPVYVHDVELYRAFGALAKDIQAALGSADPGAGKARSARLRWNKEIGASNLGERVASIPEKAQALLDASTEIMRSTRDLGDDAGAKDALDVYLEAAVGLVGAGLQGDQKAVFDENRDKFKKGAAIAAILKRESEMLAAYRPTIRDLGTSLSGRFQ